MPIVRRCAVVAAAGLLLISGTIVARSQSAEQFYKGKQLTMVVYSPAGSAYDIYARVLIRHMGKHIPGNPTFVVQYVVGAGGLKAIEYLHRIAPKDGSVMGTVGRGLPFEPFLGRNELKYDPLRLTWIGSMNREATLAMSWHTAKVKTFEDLRKTELLVPGTGAGADSEIIPRAFNSLAGTKFKIISGYRNSTEAALAMERGELEGMAYWSWTAVRSIHPTWVPEKKINLLFHTGTKPIPDLPDVRLIRNLVKNPTDKQALEFLLAREILGRPFLAPPDIPRDRVAAIRKAFDATMRDPAFLADAKKTKLDVDLVTGQEVDTVLKNASTAPTGVVARLKQALGRK
ncbi:MAG: Bug family tripartite tricarboxylate transporter substrate binding protein [Xanthobacteraceae bacterium]